MTEKEQNPSPESTLVNQADYLVELDTLLKTVFDGVVIVNNKGVIQQYNPAAEQMFGCTQEDLVGRNLGTLLPNLCSEQVVGSNDTDWKALVSSASSSVREFEARRVDGTVFPVELGVNDMRVAGELRYVTTIRDISERRRAERLIEEGDGKMQAIVDNTVDGIITIDDKGIISTYNKACESIFGYEFAEAVGQNVKMLMPEPYRHEHDGYLDNYRKSKVKKIIGIGREVQGLRKDGTVFPIDLSVSKVNVKGQTLYSGIVRDISERKEAEEKLCQVNAELEEFAYRTSHDLLSPLISSISLLKFAEDSHSKGDLENVGKMLGHTRQLLGKLEVLIADILTLTQARNEEEEDVSVDFSMLVEKVIDKFSHMDNYERLTIELALNYTDAVVVKESRLKLILENLVSNAIKYQDEGESDPFIRITTQAKDGQFVLQVQDNGLGIPDEHQAKLFTMFKRFHPDTAFGSGLGLYMIKKSADVLGGQITYDGSQKGSTFTLSIPVADHEQGQRVRSAA